MIAMYILVPRKPVPRREMPVSVIPVFGEAIICSENGVGWLSQPLGRDMSMAKQAMLVKIESNGSTSKNKCDLIHRQSNGLRG